MTFYEAVILSVERIDRGESYHRPGRLHYCFASRQDCLSIEGCHSIYPLDLLLLLLLSQFCIFWMVVSMALQYPCRARATSLLVVSPIGCTLLLPIMSMDCPFVVNGMMPSRSSCVHIHSLGESIDDDEARCSDCPGAAAAADTGGGGGSIQRLSHA